MEILIYKFILSRKCLAVRSRTTTTTRRRRMRMRCPMQMSMGTMTTPDPAGQMIQSFKRDVSTKMWRNLCYNCWSVKQTSIFQFVLESLGVELSNDMFSVRVGQLHGELQIQLWRNSRFWKVVSFEVLDQAWMLQTLKIVKMLLIVSKKNMIFPGTINNLCKRNESQAINICTLIS